MQRLVQANRVLADRREFQNIMNLKSSEWCGWWGWGTQLTAV